MQGFYDTVVDTTIPVASPREAELAKLLENTFRHVNIALVNEVAMFAHEFGIDVWEAIDAASTKPFGFMRFTPGPGVGGHCLPIDPSYLSWRVERALGHNFRFVELANDINNHMPDHVVRRITMALNARRCAVNGSRILLLGLAYKKNTGDARESPAVRVAQLLASMGAEVRGADPHTVEATPVDGLARRVEVTPEELASADAVVSADGARRVRLRRDRPARTTHPRLPSSIEGAPCGVPITTAARVHERGRCSRGSVGRPSAPKRQRADDIHVVFRAERGARGTPWNETLPVCMGPVSLGRTDVHTLGRRRGVRLLTRYPDCGSRCRCQYDTARVRAADLAGRRL